MKALVTGGAGFIGSHLVDYLLNEGYEVIVLDNFIIGREENLAHHKGDSRLSVHNVDISEPKDIKGYFEGVDYVFHLAALADIVPSIQKPLQYHKSNVTGTVSVLECSRFTNLKKFIYTASSSCYGIPDIYPTPETAEICPQYPYALTKYLGEQYVLHWGKLYNVPIISLRLFNVYGTRVRTSGSYGAVMGVFLAQKLKKMPFTLVGDGNQKRDFTYVTDVARALFLSAVSDIKGEVLNIASGKTYSINYLIELLNGEKVINIPKRPGEPDITFADISKAKRLLNWEPEVTFEEGIKVVLENIDYWRDAPLWTPEDIEKATEGWFKYLSK